MTDNEIAVIDEMLFEQLAAYVARYPGATISDLLHAFDISYETAYETWEKQQARKRGGNDDGDVLRGQYQPHEPPQSDTASARPCNDRLGAALL